MNIISLTQSTVADDSRVFDLLALEQKGLGFKGLELVVQRYQFSPALLANILGINLRTYQRRQEHKKGLSSSETGALIDVLKVLNYGLEVFEDQKKLHRWLVLPNASIRGQKPEDLLHLASGRKLIMDVLGRIDYGVYG